MKWQSTDSLDGQYFVPIPASTVIGRAQPVWIDKKD
jgi:type IV secretory pathway protease TraF